MKTGIFKRNESGKKLNALLVLALAVSLAIPPAPVWAGNDNRSINQGGTVIAAKSMPPQQPVVKQQGTTRAPTPVLKGQAPASQAQKQPVQNQKAKQTATSSVRQPPAPPPTLPAMLSAIPNGGHVDRNISILTSLPNIPNPTYANLPTPGGLRLYVQHRTGPTGTGPWSAGYMVNKIRIERNGLSPGGKPRFEVWALRPGTPNQIFLRTFDWTHTTGTTPSFTWNANDPGARIFVRAPSGPALEMEVRRLIVKQGETVFRAVVMPNWPWPQPQPTPSPIQT